jgi:hypothetical protein
LEINNLAKICERNQQSAAAAFGMMRFRRETSCPGPRILAIGSVDRIFFRKTGSPFCGKCSNVGASRA